MTRFAVLRFYPNQSNSARASGRGTYRVVDCYTAEFTCRPIQVWREPEGMFMGLMVSRAVKPRSRVDPVKLALEYVRSQG